MGTYSVTQEQVGAAFEDSHRQLRKRVVKANRRAAHKALPLVVRATPSDRGEARAGWHVLPTKRGARLTNDVPYIGILEMGSRPHWPPIMPILRWVVRKWGLNLEGLPRKDGTNSRKARGARRGFESIEEVPYTTYLLAKAICRRISEEGTEAHRMVGDNLGRMGRLLGRSVINELRRPLKPPRVP